MRQGIAYVVEQVSGLNHCPLCCVQDELLKEWDALPNVLTTSARKGDGRVALLQYIAQLRDLFTGAKVPVRPQEQPVQPQVEGVAALTGVGNEKGSVND